MHSGTTSVNHCDNDRSCDENKLKDHAATNSISCHGLREQKQRNLMSNDFTQFMNETKAYR